MLSHAQKFLLVLSIFPLLSFTFIPPHAFYLSIVEIKYDENWGDLDLKVKIFSDDLENALHKSADKQLFLRPNQESQDIDRHLHTYLKQHLQLRSGNQPIPFRLVQKTFVEDATWIYLKADGSCEMKSLTVKCSILLELFDGQTNIIRLRAYGENWISNLDRQIQEKKFLLKSGPK